MNITSNESYINRVEPIKHNIPDIKRKAKVLLLETLKSFTSIENISLFEKQNVPLSSIGICTGITNLIDIKLQELHPNICILTCDTLTKFLKDIERDFQYKK